MKKNLETEIARVLLILVHKSVCYNIITLLACKNLGREREKEERAHVFTSQC